MLHAVFRPLNWVGPATPSWQRRSRYTFKASWSSTLGLLDRELEQLRARDVVIEADFRDQDLRVDGWPRANARLPVHPGIRLAFESKHGPLIYQTDVCEYWQHNVRSIALGLEALRAVDRYGITARAEQYQGYRQIAPPQPANGFSTAEDALSWLHSFFPGQHPPLRTLVRAVARRCHPDHGGKAEDWAKFDQATRLLKKVGML